MRLALRCRERNLYGPKHIRRRTEFAGRIERGDLIICRRCEGEIGPDQLWDLGHDDRDPTWTRPEHRSCNRAAAICFPISSLLEQREAQDRAAEVSPAFLRVHDVVG